MKKSIAFFTEMGFEGKVPRSHTNSRTEFSWMIALDADHYNLYTHPKNIKYDLGIVIIPKETREFSLESIRTVCSKVAVMQEGPHWFFQDYPLERQIWYYNTIIESDHLFVHNSLDKKYFKGVTGKEEISILPSLMIEDTLNEIPEVNREGVMIGGTFVSWYGGFDSYIISQEITDNISSPSMGRSQPQEDQLVNKLPYMEWVHWMYELNKYKIGVHLMRTHAAGTFSLNCAYLGIPCIGYEGLDTQEICHPSLTVKLGDLETAKEKIRLLEGDPDFYDKCSQEAREGYETNFKEEVFLKKTSWIFDK